MKIQVLCRDKSCGLVHSSNLDHLIQKGTVVAFFRPASNVWVDVKRDRIRMHATAGYRGPERRSRQF